MSSALNGRCRARALAGEELVKALDDCNDALRNSQKASPLSARILGDRGLVRLRLGDYDKSIADYDASLKLAPKNAGSLYGRGLAKLRKKKTVEGEADMAEATILSPKIADEFKERGLTP